MPQRQGERQTEPPRNGHRSPRHEKVFAAGGRAHLGSPGGGGLREGLRPFRACLRRQPRLLSLTTGAAIPRPLTTQTLPGKGAAVLQGFLSPGV